MKLIWEASDIKGGLVVGKAGRIEQWLIAYVPNYKVNCNLYQLVSYNGDGLIAHDPLTAEEMAARLNEHGEWPIGLLDALDDALTISEAVGEEIAEERGG